MQVVPPARDRDNPQNEAKLSLALEAARLGWWQFDLESRELTASAQCKANHGLPADAHLTLDQIIESIDADHRSDFRFALEDAIRSRGTFEIEVPHRFPDNSAHWLLIRGRVVDSNTMVGVTMDTTDRKTTEEALRATKQALVEADRRKDDFLALLGHELRNPLAPILTAVSILQLKGPREPSLVKARDVIVRQTLHLSKLVDDLLDIGRITQGKLKLERTRIGLAAIVERAREMCAPGVESRGHTLVVAAVDPDLDVDADPERLVQVVCNLLNNAVKYMDTGGRIYVRGFREQGQAVISVRDEGIGIAPDMLTKIFEPFIQVGSASHRADGGIGVGLALVKSIVEMHGGTVEARSAGLGLGAEFVVRLPPASAGEGTT